MKKNILFVSLALFSTSLLAIDNEGIGEQKNFESILTEYVYVEPSTKERAPRPGEPAYYQSRWNTTLDPHVHYRTTYGRCIWGLSPEAFDMAAEWDNKGISGAVVGGIRILDISASDQTAQQEDSD